MGQQLALLLDYSLLGAEAIKKEEFAYTLPLKITRNDTQYTQVRRGKKSVIYEESFENRVHGYIVFEIRVQEERTVFDNVVPAKEKWPSNESFGQWAWCLGPNLKRAMDRFNLLEGGDHATA